MALELQQFMKSIDPFMKAVAPVVQEVTREFAKWNVGAEELRTAGWLPHYTTPFDYVMRCGGDTNAVRRALRNHYASNWQSVRSQIEQQLSDYNLDAEAKTTFREALDAHKAGLYRCVCRVLFPEIERIIRTDILDNRIGSISSKDMVEGLVDGESEPTHNRHIEDFLGNGFYELVLFEHLTEVLRKDASSEDNKSIHGLYTRVTRESLGQVKRDHVPNRHAAMHGLVVYASQQNSLNMIFMADYVFQVVSSLKTAEKVGHAS